MPTKRVSTINSIIKEYSDKINDFGFSTDVPIEVNQESVDDYKERLLKVEQLIMPLLTNLMKNPESEIIRWPNRKDILEEKITEFLKLTRG